VKPERTPTGAPNRTPITSPRRRSAKGPDGTTKGGAEHLSRFVVFRDDEGRPS
jgi:hypothetical protein